LSVTAISSFNSVAAAHGVSQGLYQVSALLELGRSEAMARQTYVWVVFENTTVGNFSGESEIRMAAFASQDGTSTPSSSNLLQITKVLHLHDAKLTNWSSLKSATQGVLPGLIPVTPVPSPVDVYGNNNSISFLTGINQGTQYSVTFTPRGEAMLATTPGAYTPYDNWIDVSLQQTHGTQVTANALDAAVVIDGSTGTVLRVSL
jgi:hypothetical protein